jgi:hypothetical protein
MGMAAIARDYPPILQNLRRKADLQMALEEGSYSLKTVH